MDIKGIQWISTEFNIMQLNSMGMNGIQWTSTESIELNGIQLGSMEFKAIQWNSKQSMEFNDIQWNSGIQCSLVNSTFLLGPSTFGEFLQNRTFQGGRIQRCHHDYTENGWPKVHKSRVNRSINRFPKPGDPLT